MTCTWIQSNSSRSPDIELIVPVSDAELLATVTVQKTRLMEILHQAPKTVNASHNTLVAGGIAVLARVATTGEPAGLECSVPGNQTTEIAGIGVRVPSADGMQEPDDQTGARGFQCECYGCFLMAAMKRESTAVLDSLRPAKFCTFRSRASRLSRCSLQYSLPVPQSR